MSKILIIEDELSIAELERDYLELNDFEVEIETNGINGLEKALSEEYSLILLDLMLPDMDGFEICRQIREKKDIPIIMVTAKKNDIDKIRGLGLGVDDYVTKPFGMMELISRIKAVLRRSAKGSVSSEDTFEIGEIRLDPKKHEVTVHGEVVNLTLKEYELLKRLMKNSNIVLTRDQLLEDIWGYDFDGETRTVDVHVRTLRQKLGDAGEQIETVRGVGYRMSR